MYSDLTSAYDAEGSNREAPGTVRIAEHDMVAIDEQRFDEEQCQANVESFNEEGQDWQWATCLRAQFEDQQDLPHDDCHVRHEDKWAFTEEQQRQLEEEWKQREQDSQRQFDQPGCRRATCATAWVNEEECTKQEVYDLMEASGRAGDQERHHELHMLLDRMCGSAEFNDVEFVRG